MPAQLPHISTCSVVDGGVVPRLPAMSANNFVFEIVDDKYGIDLPGNPSSRSSSGSVSSVVSRGAGSAVSAPGKRVSNRSLRKPRKGPSSLRELRRFSTFGNHLTYSFLKYGSDTDDLLRKVVQAVRPTIQKSALAEAEEDDADDDVSRDRTGSAAEVAATATTGKALSARVGGSSRTNGSARSMASMQQEKEVRTEKFQACLVGGMNNIHRFLCAYVPLVFMENERAELKEYVSLLVFLDFALQLPF